MDAEDAIDPKVEAENERQRLLDAQKEMIIEPDVIPFAKLGDAVRECQVDIPDEIDPLKDRGKPYKPPSGDPYAASKTTASSSVPVPVPVPIMAKSPARSSSNDTTSGTSTANNTAAGSKVGTIPEGEDFLCLEGYEGGVGMPHLGAGVGQYGAYEGSLYEGMTPQGGYNGPYEGFNHEGIPYEGYEAGSILPLAGAAGMRRGSMTKSSSHPGFDRGETFDRSAPQSEKLQKYWELYSSHAANAKKYRAMIIEMQNLPSSIPEDGYPQSGSARSSSQMQSRASPAASGMHRTGSVLSVSTPYVSGSNTDHPEFEIATNEGTFTPYGGRKDTMDLSNSKDLLSLNTSLSLDPSPRGNQSSSLDSSRNNSKEGLKSNSFSNSGSKDFSKAFSASGSKAFEPGHTLGPAYSPPAGQTTSILSSPVFGVPTKNSKEFKSQKTPPLHPGTPSTPTPLNRGNSMTLPPQSASKFSNASSSYEPPLNSNSKASTSFTAAGSPSIGSALNNKGETEKLTQEQIDFRSQ